MSHPTVFTGYYFQACSQDSINSEALLCLAWEKSCRIDVPCATFNIVAGNSPRIPKDVFYHLKASYCKIAIWKCQNLHVPYQSHFPMDWLPCLFCRAGVIVNNRNPPQNTTNWYVARCSFGCRKVIYCWILIIVRPPLNMWRCLFRLVTFEGSGSAWFWIMMSIDFNLLSTDFNWFQLTFNWLQLLLNWF